MVEAGVVSNGGDSGLGVTMAGIAGCECGGEVVVRDADEWGAWRGKLVERRRGRGRGPSGSAGARQGVAAVLLERPLHVLSISSRDC